MAYTNTLNTENNRKQNKTAGVVIGILGVLIPVVVAVLLFMPQTGKLGDFDVSFLPHLNGVLNSATAIALLVGYYFIKNKNWQAHRTAMLSAFGISSLFLISYVLYHFQAPSTKFGDLDHNGVLSDIEKQTIGTVRYVYYFFLLTHIVLAAVIVPMVLGSIYLGITQQVERHKKLSKFTFPVWLYVAVTGVLVYLMIKPYYV